MNNLGYAIRKRRLRRIQPINKALDPYIAAVLTAATSTSWSCNEKRTGIDDVAENFKVHVLALSEFKVATLYFYTARIPSKFLNRWDSPSRYIPSKPFRIAYHQISFHRLLR